MPDFACTFQRLRADHSNSTWWISIASGLALAAWIFWALFAQVSLYEVSTDARVELDGATYPIDSPFAGRIVATSLHTGRPVRRGDLLIEIDAEAEELQLHEVQVQAQGLAPQIAQLNAQIDAERSMRSEEDRAARLRAQEAESRIHEAQVPADYAEKNLARIRALRAENYVSAHDLEKAESDASQLRAAASALEMAANRIPQDQAARNREREVRIGRLQGEIATLEAQRDTLQAETARLNYEIERRRIRAPVDGLIGEAVNLRVGAVVAATDRLGSIVPAGRLLVVAHYPAQAAFGRIRAGQRATLRLDGFPWAEFGTVSATVAEVGREVRDGKVRVELALLSRSSFRGSLEHGMPGTLEVAVERLSPLNLILRTAGQWLTRPL
ncbi:MAG: HlyD family secretion protein [Steroidobacteraceae bacterium]|jgi:membrane fusion protein (multidrug efflux system)